jgi:hypothetical protein
MILAFAIGAVFGCLVGAGVMALAAAAGHADLIAKHESDLALMESRYRR